MAGVVGERVGVVESDVVAHGPAILWVSKCVVTRIFLHEVVESAGLARGFGGINGLGSGTAGNAIDGALPEHAFISGKDEGFDGAGGSGVRQQRSGEDDG